MWQHFDIIFIIILASVVYIYCRIKIDDFLEFSPSLFLFGIILLLIGSILVLSMYSSATLVDTILLKNDIFLERFFLLGYMAIFAGGLGKIEKLFFQKGNKK